MNEFYNKRRFDIIYYKTKIPKQKKNNIIFILKEKIFKIINFDE
jgi:hypothetical protein